MGMQIAGSDWVTEPSHTQAYLKVIIFHEANNFTILNRRKNREKNWKFAENELSEKVKNKNKKYNTENANKVDS